MCPILFVFWRRVLCNIDIDTFYEAGLKYEI